MRNGGVVIAAMVSPGLDTGVVKLTLLCALPERFVQDVRRLAEQIRRHLLAMLIELQDLNAPSAHRIPFDQRRLITTSKISPGKLVRPGYVISSHGPLFRHNLDGPFNLFGGFSSLLMRYIAYTGHPHAYFRGLTSGIASGIK